MCGLAGHHGPDPLPPERLRACLEALGRRGPDHAAWKHFERDGWHTYLLHTRLAIIDLDARANQPFGADGHWLASNGELYNYLELRAELEQAGHTFHTSSDTEVQLRALAHWGPREALDRSEGMWAWACYREADGRLFLARDRFGEKPLHLHRRGPALTFASETNALFALLGERLPIDREHVRRYLVNGYKSLRKQPASFFLGQEELPAGQLLERGPDGSERVERYWTPPVARDEAMSYEQAVAGTREHLLRAVELRLRADVPLAFCLSGGVDSNALVGVARNGLGREVHGFTIVNTDSRYEEQELVELAVREQGLKHTAIPLRPEGFLDGLREQVRYHAAPVITVTYYVHWLLMREVAAAGYKVSVSGTAADELFTGYFDHHNAYLAEVAGDPEQYARSLAAWEAHVRPVVRNPCLQDPRWFLENPAAREHIYLDAERFASYLQAPFAEPFREERYAEGILRNRMLNELFHESVPVILNEDDLNAMQHSIENRSPFLDRRLFEHTTRIPTRHLIRDGRAKAVLRDAVRGLVPDPILDNPRKVGFNAPIQDLLDPRDPEVRDCVLGASPIFELVRREPIEDLLAQERLPNSQSKFLFYFLSAKLFLEEFAA